jgi:pilus assembly protein CpaF
VVNGGVDNIRFLDSSIAEAQEVLLQRVQERLTQDLDAGALEEMEDADRQTQVEVAARRILTEIAPALGGVVRQDIVKEAVDEVLGLGPLQPLLEDVNVTEVMVNSPTEIYFEREGVLYLSAAHFRDEDHIRRIAERIVIPLGRHIDDAFPMVDARLPDGSRVNVVLPPIAVGSPTITIRKFRTDRFDVEDLIRIGTLTEDAGAFLRACVASKVNIVISGGTGSGKTTLLNALSAYIPAQERIVTVEDPTEIKLRQPHAVRLEARPPGAEGRGEVTQRDLVRNALRMRPDRIIVGEVRGPEAFDMMQAMNTGHEGSITTAHANAPRDALTRIENMILMAGFDLPVRSIREQIVSALHLIIQIGRMSDGTRRITHITEIAGLEGEVITLQDLFLFHGKRVNRRGKVEGELRPTGIRPRFADRFEEHGIVDPLAAMASLRDEPGFETER